MFNEIRFRECEPRWVVLSFSSSIQPRIPSTKAEHVHVEFIDDHWTDGGSTFSEHGGGPEDEVLLLIELSLKYKTTARHHRGKRRKSLSVS